MIPNHAEYIESWLKVLKNDVIFTAASKAHRCIMDRGEGSGRKDRGMQFSPDGKTVVTASWDRTARLWDAASGRELQVLRGHDRYVNSAQFSPDGKTVVTASLDRTGRLWDAASGKELHVLHAHGSVSSAQFSAGGETVLTASTDGTASLWDAASGRELQVLRGHENQISGAQFSPDGKTVLTASGDKTARLWLCWVCRPTHKIVAELTTSIGRGLTEEEQRRFGLKEAKTFHSPPYSRGRAGR